MLNIYYGRENLNKSKFIFDNIKGKTLLLVPDQFSLQTERDAFFYLNKTALADIDVMSFSRMGNEVISKTGGKGNIIGREGRQMLLAKIIREKQKELEIFGGSAEKIGFVEMVHDLIADFKRQNTGIEMLKKICDGKSDNVILTKKLSEVMVIFEEYEKRISGKYMDNEDLISMFTSKIHEAEFILERDIWIYGFDSFTEKNIDIILELTANAKSVNLVLTMDEDSRDENIFYIAKDIIQRLGDKLENMTVEKIPQRYVEERNEDMYHLEREIYAIPFNKRKDEGHITLLRASNHYSEAASSAQFVLSLIRDKGYRYNDIAIICNDMENKGELYRRVFDEYGITLFLDSKRSIQHHPGANYILSLLNILDKNFQKDDVIRYLKTGLVCESDEDVEDIEIYAKKYRISGKRWKEDFDKGNVEYGEEELARLNEIRREIIQPIEKFNKEFTEEKTVKGKVLKLYSYLKDNCKLPDKIEIMVEEQESDGNLELAEETAQVWNMIANILDQMVEILDDTKISKKDFTMLVKSGLDSIKIGVIPPSVDGLIMGSMARTRRGKIKATVVVGAEAGLLPAENKNIGILTEEEKRILCEDGIDICRSPQTESIGESLAIYRNLSKTEEILYMSYSVSDDEGGSVEPSNIYLKIKEIFGDKKEIKDIFNQNDVKKLMGGKEITKNNMVAQMIKISNGEAVDHRWQGIYNWFLQNDNIDKIVEELTEEFGVENLTPEEVSKLFMNREDDVLSLSPSRLEKFGNCPFAHFVTYGLRPEENREYTIGAPEAGTIYHKCLMEISKKIDEKNLWMTITEDEVRQDVKEILMDISKDFKEGILTDGEEERYKAERIQTVCLDTAWMAVEHVRKGNIKDMHFEVSFGRGKFIPELEIKDDKIILEGQIDRWDILDGDYSKVIDYKSGKDAYSEKEAKAGIKLQLFIYLMATLRRGIKPGGAFYFHIDEALSKSDLNVKEAIEKQYKMDGFLLDDEQVIRAIDSGEEKKKSVFKNGKNSLLDEESFHQLLDAVNLKIQRMAEDISQGEIGIKPKKINNKISCRYCAYKGVCKFDLSVEGCSYNMI